jgi:hypothetical protein
LSFLSMMDMAEWNSPNRGKLVFILLSSWLNSSLGLDQ